MKKLLLLIGLLVVLSTNVIAETKIIKNKEFKKIGTVEVLEGRAFQQYFNNKWKRIHYEPLALGDPIYQGTLVETKEEDVKFGIVFDDNTTLTIEGPSQIFVGIMNYSPGDLDSYFWMSIYYGKFAIESGEIAKIYDGAMEIDLPNATLKINGTTLKGYVPPYKDSSTNKKLHEKNIVVLLEDGDGQVGEVIVYNDKGNFTLSGNNESSAIDKKGNQTLSDASGKANEVTFLANVNELLEHAVVQKLNADEDVLKKMVASQKKLKKLDDLNDDGKISVEDENLFIEQIRETKQTRIELDQKIKNIKDLGKEEYFSVKQELEEFTKKLEEAKKSGNAESIKIARDNLLESEEYFMQTKKEIRTARQDAIFEASLKNREINKELLEVIKVEEKNVLEATVEFYKIKKSKKKEKKQALALIDEAKEKLIDLKSELNVQAVLQLNDFVEEYKQDREANMEALQEERRTMIQENKGALIELKNAEKNLKSAHESGNAAQIELAKERVEVKEQIKQEKFEPATVKAEINVMDIVGLGQQALDEFFDAQEKSASLAKENTELLQKEQLKAKEEYEKKIQALDQAYELELQKISEATRAKLDSAAEAKGAELDIKDFQDASTYEKFLNPDVSFIIQNTKDQYAKEEIRISAEAVNAGAYGGERHKLMVEELEKKRDDAINLINVQAEEQAKQRALASAKIDQELQIHKQQLEIQLEIQAEGKVAEMEVMEKILAEKDQALIDQVEALKQVQVQAEERAMVNTQVLLQAEKEFQEKERAIQEIQKSAIKQEIEQQKEEQKAELEIAKEERKEEIQQAKEEQQEEMTIMMGGATGMMPGMDPMMGMGPMGGMGMDPMMGMGPQGMMGPGMGPQGMMPGMDPMMGMGDPMSMGGGIMMGGIEVGSGDMGPAAIYVQPMN
jgi:hypothetical protein